MNPTPTMREIAKACGCSQATVSLALRGDRTIPEPTRQRIAEVAHRMGYRSNPLVSALMSLKRQRRPVRHGTVIAYVTSHRPNDPWRSRPFYVAMFEGAVERARELGCEIEEFNLRAPHMTARRLRAMFDIRGILGAIIAPLPNAERRLDLDLSGLAAVGLGLSVAQPTIERVSNDHFQSMKLAVQQCLALGYRRLGFAISQETSKRLEDRWLAGFSAALEVNQVETRLPVLMPKLQRDIPGSLPEWLERGRPDVVILGNAEQEIQERIPVSIGLVSLGVTLPRGPLAGIYQNDRLIGQTAAERVIANLQANRFNAPEEGCLYLIAGHWVEGVSVPGPGHSRPSVDFP